ncbi:MAG TPA: type II toxin-antitoxin system Phd/YefM family antitoxin [Gemmatimonadales bacterium]|nr:type II toxin-antitoxin system Phd/YefM family antitoxin [Gemmatimonadales bacterium]
MATVGISEFRKRLSHYLCQVEQVDMSFTITRNGRPVARLVPVPTFPPERWQQLIEAGVVIPPVKHEPIRFCGTGSRLPPGTALKWLDQDRNER